MAVNLREIASAGSLWSVQGGIFLNISFKRLEAEDVRGILPFFHLRSNITCDSTIFDSYLWRDFYHVEYAIVEDILLMKMEEEGECFGALPLCRPERMQHGFDLLEHYFREELGTGLRIYDADETGMKLLELDPNRYIVTEEPDHADYIYDGQALRTLSGRAYHKKKNNINAFLRAYDGRWEYSRLGVDAREEIWNFLKRWRAGKEESVEEHLEAEMRGLKDYLDHMDQIPSIMAGIRIDGVLEAFTIGSYNPADRMSIVHVEKANGEIRGLYTLINREFQTREFPDALLVNREDDVGLPSLRKAKESYHPVMMGRKYDISPRCQEA